MSDQCCEYTSVNSKVYKSASLGGIHLILDDNVVPPSTFVPHSVSTDVEEAKITSSILSKFVLFV